MITGIKRRHCRRLGLFYVLLQLSLSIHRTFSFTAQSPLRHDRRPSLCRLESSDGSVETKSRPDTTETAADVQNMIERARTELQPYFNFPLDDWQLQAGGAILEGYNVIVSAPTGAG